MTGVCVARRIGTDQMQCARCRLAWDLDDPEPPVCGKTLHAVDVPAGFISGLAGVDSPHRSG